MVAVHRASLGLVKIWRETLKSAEILFTKHYRFVQSYEVLELIYGGWTLIRSAVTTTSIWSSLFYGPVFNMV